MNTGQLSKNQLWNLTPPGWPLFALTFIAIVLELWPEFSPFRVMPSAKIYPFLAVVTLVWGLRLLCFFIVLSWCRRRLKGLNVGRQWYRWFITPAAFMLTLQAIDNDWPLRVVLWFNQDQMVRVAQQAMASPANPPPDQSVGFYYAQHIRAIPGGAYFIVGGNERPTARGFAYSPGTEPAIPPDVRRQCRHLSGDWYVWWGSRRALYSDEDAAAGSSRPSGGR